MSAANPNLRERVARALYESVGGDWDWVSKHSPEGHYTELADVALAALGLDDLDAAAQRANIDHPHTGLQIGTNCAKAVLLAALGESHA